MSSSFTAPAADTEKYDTAELAQGQRSPQLQPGQSTPEFEVKTGVDPDKYSSFAAGEIFFHDIDEDAYNARPRKPSDLVRPPVVRQWLVNGKLYRERFEREQSRFELFFDLVFVAFAHLLSDAASETANGASFLEFLLTFYPAWSLWSEFRTFMNQSGTDDITVRINILFLMAVLVGYSANASAIHLGSSETSALAEGAPAVAEHAARALFRRAEEAATEQASNATSDRALVAAVAFFIVGRGSRIPLQLFYAWRLPQFAKSFVAQASLHIFIVAICLPLIWVTKTRTILILACFSMAMDLVGRFIPTMLVLLQRDLFVAKIRRRPDLVERFHEKCKDEFDVERPYFSKHHMPAINIEHHIERTVSFVIIVFGELVISVVYHAMEATLGLSVVYGRAVLGLIIAFNLAWIYWDVEASGTFVHALRRHWFTAIMWNQLHWPLSCALILASAALSRLVLLEEEVTPGHRWYFGAGLGCAMITLGAIGMVHRSLEPRGLTRISRDAILALRVAVGIVMCCLPLVKPSRLSATVFLAIPAGLTTLVVALETYGKLHNAAAAYAESDSQTIVEPGDIVQVEVENAELVEVPVVDIESPVELDTGTNGRNEREVECRTWKEWVQIERARKQARNEGKAMSKAFKKNERMNARIRQWQRIQAECRRVDALAGACGGA